MARQGWEYWSQESVRLTREAPDGTRYFEDGDGYVCECPPGVEPGDADSYVYHESLLDLPR